MDTIFSIFTRITAMGVAMTMIPAVLFGQTAQEREVAGQVGGGLWFAIVAMAFGAVGLGYFVWRRVTLKAVTPGRNGDRSSNYYNSNESYEMEGLDVDKELEWLRKAKKNKAAKARTLSVKPLTSRVKSPASTLTTEASDLDTKAFQEKMRKLQYSQLPINSFVDLQPPRNNEPLPISNDPGLLNAIDQANEEYEEDESVRDIALRILAAFKTQNSVDALTQIALYDLSSNLRSKAVSALTDFDHASVFEPILLACADPTREVRAAAARGLFRLSFDRADAWKRIMDTKEDFRKSHAAKAVIESGIAVKSFDRLIHEDLKVAHEAFALVSFIIDSGETDEIFKAIKSHKDERVKFALLHTIKVRKDERALIRLAELKASTTFSDDVKIRINDVIASFDPVLV